MIESISNREAARRAGLNESTLRTHRANGGLAAAVLPDGKLDAKMVEKLLPRIVQRVTVAPPALALAKTRRLRAQVQRAADEVKALRTISVRPTAFARMVAAQLAIVARHFRLVPTQAIALAGRPAAEVQRALRNLVFDALEGIHAEEPEVAWWDDPPERPAPVDIAELDPNALLARRIDLVAEAMEINRARAHGELVDVDEAVEAFGMTLTNIKSGMLALPARVSQAVANAEPGDVEGIVSAEVEELLVEATR